MTDATDNRAARTPSWRQNIGNALPMAPPAKVTPLGWMCPVCEKGNAPWAATCGHCPRKKAPTYG